MSATIIPLRSAAQRQADALWDSIQREALRRTHQHIAEAWKLKAESAAIRRRYEERQARIAVLMARYPDVERA
jgi:hypothetical protein